MCWILLIDLVKAGFYNFNIDGEDGGAKGEGMQVGDYPGHGEDSAAQDGLHVPQGPQEGQRS